MPSSQHTAKVPCCQRTRGTSVGGQDDVLHRAAACLSPRPAGVALRRSNALSTKSKPLATQLSDHVPRQSSLPCGIPFPTLYPLASRGFCLSVLFQQEP